MEKLQNSKIGKIYTLSCKDGNVFYIGCTVMDLSTRLRGHISEANSFAKNSNMYSINKAKANKIVDLGFDVYATIIEVINVNNDYLGRAILRRLEAKIIAQYIDAGCQLVNCSFQNIKPVEPLQVVGLKISAKDLSVQNKATA